MILEKWWIGPDPLHLDWLLSSSSLMLSPERKKNWLKKKKNVENVEVPSEKLQLQRKVSILPLSWDSINPLTAWNQKEIIEI